VNLATFTTGYVLVFAAFAAARGDRRVIAYIAVIGVLAAVVQRVHRRAPLPGATCWALSVCGLLHMAGGLLPSPDSGAPIFYETWLIEPVLKYDQFTHFTVTAVVTIACWSLIGGWLDPAAAGLLPRAFLAGAVAVACGAVNEVFEFLSALRFPDAFIGGIDNVGWDLVFNLFGAVSAAVWLVLASPRRRPRTPRPSDGRPRRGTARAGTS
jgi:putative membrane protein